MIEHVSLRCSDSKRSRAFYESALTPLGYAVKREYGDAFGFMQGGRTDFWVTEGEVGTPTHIAFQARVESAVDAFYAAAMQAGGRDNGPPGDREGYGYAAFVYDPDGHNVEAVIWDEDRRRVGRAKKGARGGAKKGARGAAKKGARGAAGKGARGGAKKGARAPARKSVKRPTARRRG